MLRCRAARRGMWQHRGGRGTGRETRSVVRLTRAFAPCQSGRACKPTGPNITTQNFSCPSLRLFRMRWVFSRPPRPAVAQGNPPVAGQCFPPIPPGQELREPAQCATSVPSVSTVRRAVRRSVWRRSVLFQRRRATVGAVHPAVGPANRRRRDYLAEGRASRYPWDGGWLIWDVLSTTHLGYDTHTGPYDESHLHTHLRLDAVAHAAASRPPGRDSRPGLAAGPAARAPVRLHIGLSQSNVVHGQGHLALVHHYTPLTAWHPSWLPDTPPVLLS